MQVTYYSNNSNNSNKSPGARSRSLLITCAVNALAMVIADKVVSGLQFDSLLAVAFAALMISLINMSLKPVIHILALPFTVLSFGLFALVINGLMLELVAFFSPGFTIASFGSAILGSIIITLSNIIINALVGNN